MGIELIGTTRLLSRIGRMRIAPSVDMHLGIIYGKSSCFDADREREL